MMNAIGYVTSSSEAYALLSRVLDGDLPDEMLCAFLGELQHVPFSEKMLLGFKEAMMERASTIDLKGMPTIDICGTGGDGKDTFNISTLAAILVASCGYKVTKHGNTAFSSKCGSSDVLMRCGVKFPVNAEQAQKQLDRCGITFLHAPYFHPALKAVGMTRKKLGIRTVFNILGPLCNPASPTLNVLGVASFKVFRAYKAILEQQPANRRFVIIWDENGYDEISLTARSFLYINGKDHILEPKLYINRVPPQQSLIAGNDIEKSIQIFKTIINGEGNEIQNSVVAINAATAIHLSNPLLSLQESFEQAKEILISGKLKSILNKLQND